MSSNEPLTRRTNAGTSKGAGRQGCMPGMCDASTVNCCHEARNDMPEVLVAMASQCGCGCSGAPAAEATSGPQMV
jgi:hypothetical protein